MNRFQFLLYGIRNIKTMGTITPSSSILCKNIIKPIDFNNANCIIELGAGNGVITKHLLEAMNPNTQLLSFEINPDFSDTLSNIKDKRFHYISDSAENIGVHLNQRGFEYADYVVSAIPFVALPDELADKIISTAKDYLKTGGLFIQFHYSLLAKKKYQRIFGNVDTNLVIRNIPPAFVMVSENQDVPAI